jgi:hypothetical protein
MVKKLSLTFFLLTVVSAGIFSQGVSDSVSPGISDSIALGMPDSVALGVSDSVLLKLSPVNQATLFGAGKVFFSDTYLSPLKYDGLTFSLLHERLNGSSLFNEKLLLQQQFQIQLASADNPTKTGSSYYGNLYYGINGFYPLVENNRLRWYGGAGWNAELGGIYNERNSNNPGSMKASTNLNLATMALFDWRMFTFRWQLSTPIMGVFFSPKFGQSYYEIFTLGDDDGTVIFGSLHNQRAVRNYFTVDFHVGNLTIRTGYLGNYYHTDVNHIVTKILSHQFMIGLAVESLNVGGKRLKQNRWLHSVYYNEP